MKRLKISSFICVLAIGLALLLPGAEGTEAASSSHGRAWKIVPSANVGSGDNHLNGVTAISTSDIWAVGNSSNSSNAPAQALIEHWDGIQWSVVANPIPNAWSSDLTAVTAISTSDVWAVGSLSSSSTQTLIEHWDGTQWSIVPSPNPSGYSNTLLGVTTISSNDVWAVGNFVMNATSHSQTLTEHWDGTQWSVVPSVNVGTGDNTLSGVTASSSNDVWVVGTGHKGLVEHWDGTQWSVVLNTGYDFTAITAITSRDVWAVGYSLRKGLQQTLIEHWNGSIWRRVSSPNPGGLSEYRGVVALSSHNIWAIGYYDSSLAQTLIEHWDGKHWGIVASPNTGSLNNFLLGGTSIPGTKQAIAVGYYYILNTNPETGSTAQTLVASYS